MPSGAGQLLEPRIISDRHIDVEYLRREGDSMHRFIAMLLAAIVSVGCASPAPPSNLTSRTPSPPTERSTSSEGTLAPLEDLFPGVPLYPPATKHDVLPDQRAFMQVKGESVVKAMTWYDAHMRDSGWEAVQVGLADELVRLFVRGGSYLSISGHDLPDGDGSVVWFHLRNTPEISRDGAVVIAKNTHHRVQANWTVTLLQEFESVGHPVWLVEEPTPGNDAIWIGAITAEPFRIRQ